MVDKGENGLLLAVMAYGGLLLCDPSFVVILDFQIATVRIGDFGDVLSPVEGVI